MLLPQFALSKTIKEQQSAVSIGGISELNGSAQIVRDEPLDAELKFSIQSNDEAITTNGRMAIKFLDDSIVRLTEHSQLLIDEYIYDPDPSKSKMSLTFGLGTVRFVTGKLNKIDKQNIKLRTPTANIAIRGTDFTTTVDELGRSLIILLPDALGLSSGEILVTTAMGSVILNKPFQATTVSVFESKPSSPVILDLSLDMIDNMLIVTPPKSEAVIENQAIVKTKNILDFNDLDIDYLDYDALAKDELDYSSDLDYDALDTNYLEDLLNILDSLAISEEEDALADANGISISGTTFGQDKETQITTLVVGDIISVRRKVNDSVRLDLNTNESYTLIIIQDGVSNLVKINGGGSIITITQSD